MDKPDSIEYQMMTSKAPVDDIETQEKVVAGQERACSQKAINVMPIHFNLQWESQGCFNNYKAEGYH